MPSRQVVLLGDSVFDNASYVGGAPDVVRQLRSVLPGGWSAELRAVDGAVAAHVAGQARGLAADAVRVVSAGGNDALRHVGILEQAARSVAEALERLHDAADAFEAEYRRMLRDVALPGLRVGVCTIYHPRFPEPRLRRLAAAGLAAFNDAILRAAFSAGLPVVDLRLVCSSDADFANPIEPSERGGARIAAAVARLATEHDFARGRTEVYVG